MSKAPQTFGDIAASMRPRQKQGKAVQVEKYVIVPKGAEMTPEMRSLLEAALLDLVKSGAIAFNNFRSAELLVLISDTVRFVETLYLGTNKQMLKDIEQGLKLEREHKLVGPHED